MLAGRSLGWWFRPRINRIESQQNICSRPFSSPSVPIHLRWLTLPDRNKRYMPAGLSANHLPTGVTSSIRIVGWKYIRPSVTCQERIRMCLEKNHLPNVSLPHFHFTVHSLVWCFAYGAKHHHPDLQGVTGTNLFNTNKQHEQRNRTGSRCGLNYHTFRRVITLHISGIVNVKLLIMGEYVLCASQTDGGETRLRGGRSVVVSAMEMKIMFLSIPRIFKYFLYAPELKNQQRWWWWWQGEVARGLGLSCECCCCWGWWSVPNWSLLRLV